MQIYDSRHVGSLHVNRTYVCMYVGAYYIGT